MMDSVFYANVVLLGLFFAFFGSRFVVSPGVELVRADFKLPVSGQAVSAAVSTTAVISVLGPDMVFTDEGRMSYAELAQWLPSQVARGAEEESRLLIRADTRVSVQDLAKMTDLATRAGFASVHLALEAEDNQTDFGAR